AGASLGGTEGVISPTGFTARLVQDPQNGNALDLEVTETLPPSPPPDLVLGIGTNFFDDGEADKFMRVTATGQLEVVGAEGNLRLVTDATGAALTVDPTTAVIGGGADFFGSNEHAIFVRTASGQFEIWQINSNGMRDRAVTVTSAFSGGAPVAIDP